MKFNVQEVFDRYTNNDNLSSADIFHLYDTGRECMEDNSGYNDSRHFRLVAFNTVTMEKKDLGIHDGITSSLKDRCDFYLARVYADGSFLIRLRKPVSIENSQCIFLGGML